MISVTRHLSGYLANLTLKDLPPEVVAKAKWCLIDHLACAFTGYDLPWVRAAVDLVRATGGSGPARIWGYRSSVAAWDATFANCLQVNGIIQEDMHSESGAHLGVVVVPTALAMAEALNRRGADVLVSMVAGYDAMGRVGKAIATPEFFDRGFRPTAVFGPLGSAAAAGWLHDFDESQLTAALGFAGELAGGLNQWAMEGRVNFMFQTASAARNGIMAAEMVRRGVLGPERILEGEKGFCRAYAGTFERLPLVTEALGTHFEIMASYHKPHPACAYTQEVGQTALQLIAKHLLHPSDVDEIVVSGYSLMKENPGCDFSGPFESIVQSQMSTQFAVAAAIVHGKIDFDLFRNYENPQVNAVARKTRVEIDPAAVAAYPTRKLCRISVRTTDGRMIEEVGTDLRYPHGAELEDKFRKGAERLFSPRRQHEILQAVHQIETIDRIKEFTEILCSDL